MRKLVILIVVFTSLSALAYADSNLRFKRLRFVPIMKFVPISDSEHLSVASDVDFLKFRMDPEKVPPKGIILYFFSLNCQSCKRLKPVISMLLSIYESDELLFVPVLVVDKSKLEGLKDEISKLFPKEDFPTIGGIYLDKIEGAVGLKIRDPKAKLPYLVAFDRNLKPVFKMRKRGIGIHGQRQISRYFRRLVDFKVKEKMRKVSEKKED